jgi:integrase
MSIYKRGENWYIDFTFKGQRVRESIGPSRKGAEKVISKKKAEIAENKYLDVRKDPDPIKFHDFAKEYLQWSKTNKKESTYCGDLIMMRHLDNEFEEKMIQEINLWDIEKWKAKRKEKVKPAPVNRELALAKSLFSKAVEWGKIKESPAKKVKFLKLKGSDRRVKFLMADEVQKLISNCSNKIRPVVIIALNTGMRRSELLDLKWDQVNFEQGILTLLDTKNNDRRDIPMNETVKNTLRAMERRGPYIFDGITPQIIKYGFSDARIKAGRPDLRFHDLRHCFASGLVMEGVDLNTTRELLGHRDLKMTLRYAHLAPSYKTKAVNVLDKSWSQNPPQEEEVKKVISLRR